MSVFLLVICVFFAGNMYCTVFSEYFISWDQQKQRYRFRFHSLLLSYSFRGQHEKENKTLRDLQEDNTEGQTLRGRSAAEPQQLQTKLSITHLLVSRVVPWDCILRGHSASDTSYSEQQGALPSFKAGLNLTLKSCLLHSDMRSFCRLRTRSSDRFHFRWAWSELRHFWITCF